MNINLNHLATFQLVVSRGSFSDAAQVLGLSQPAVSLQIRQLEERVRARLLERTGRGIKPTAAGISLLEHCANIDQAVTAALHSVSAHCQEISGSVLLGTGATACIHLIPPLLQQLRLDYPLLTAGVTTGNTRDIVSAVEENRIDIGLVTLPVTETALAVTPLFEDEFVVITAVQGREALHRFTADELQAQPLIVFESGSSTRALIDSWFISSGQVAQPIMALGSIEAIKRMVRAELGYSIVPRMSVVEAADRTGLGVYSLAPRLHRTLAFVMRQDKIVSKEILAVIRAIRQQIGEELCLH